MLKESYSQFQKIYLVCGYTDLRKGIDGLATLIQTRLELDPFQRDILFLFCGHSSKKIKGLLWEGDGFLLLYKRIEAGSLTWPRTSAEAMQLTEEQFQLLMCGFSIVAKRPVRDVNATVVC